MSRHKLGFWVLTALVIGNMVGSGIFMLPRSLAEAASPAGVLLAWAATGFGVLMLALVFGSLAVRKPELSGGPQIYAKELFRAGSHGSLLAGFMSTWGYWVGNIAGFVAVITTFTSYLSTFFPVLTSDKIWLTIGSLSLQAGNVLSFIVCSVLLWGTHAICLHGIKGAGRLNFIATATKVIGFVLFIVIALFAFQQSNIGPFVAPRTSESGASIGLLSQVNGAAVATLWAFIGVESAMVFAARARRKQDIRRATIAGLLISLVLYVGISLLTMGLLTQEQLIASQNPLVDGISAVLGSVGGKWLAGLGLISLLGSTVGWVLLSAEVPFQAAKLGVFLPSFSKENSSGMPKVSLWISNVLGQILLLSTLSSSLSAAFDFIIYIATLAYLVPYLIAAVYHLKLTLIGETYLRLQERWTEGVIAGLASIYSLWVIIAGTADLKTFLLGLALIVVGILFYPLLLLGKKKGKAV
ncbi:amino acid permease [Paenibacillus physcomitrellae]|uniref:Arginine:ornithine antiporter n=1 Tax=Paenibacillus physcomitrellae TaxID=1619311 RepID=A0ABQ1FV91_9BACL|nr:amino acid permease [Paenibacillus physcomitrellae]GGA29786.1 arginine:ornithine antiporter [Paenibacillus physcomitrellae]